MDIIILLLGIQLLSRHDDDYRYSLCQYTRSLHKPLWFSTLRCIIVSGFDCCFSRDVRDAFEIWCLKTITYIIIFVRPSTNYVSTYNLRLRCRIIITKSYYNEVIFEGPISFSSTDRVVCYLCHPLTSGYYFGP